jgi:hypothetical protein
MAVFADRVAETTTTTGLGTYHLLGASAAHQTFVVGVGDASTVRYCAYNDTDWEVGEGVVSDLATDTLTRVTILSSSNAGSAVSWSSGTRDIVLVQDAASIQDVLDNIALHHANVYNPHSVTQTQVGLSNVDNTSDADKPVSTAQQAALDTAITDLVGSAPAALDTLNELAASLDDDANFAGTITTSLAAATADRAAIRSEHVAGATALTAAIATAVSDKVEDSQVLTDVPANALFTDTVYTHPNHTGEVTSIGDGTTVIVDNIVDEANLKVSNNPSNGQYLSAQSGVSGGLTWTKVDALPAGGGVNMVLTKASTTDGDAQWVDTLDEVNMNGGYF